MDSFSVQSKVKFGPGEVVLGIRYFMDRPRLVSDPISCKLFYLSEEWVVALDCPEEVAAITKSLRLEFTQAVGGSIHEFCEMLARAFVHSSATLLEGDFIEAVTEDHRFSKSGISRASLRELAIIDNQIDFLVRCQVESKRAILRVLIDTHTFVLRRETLGWWDGWRYGRFEEMEGETTEEALERYRRECERIERESGLFDM